MPPDVIFAGSNFTLECTITLDMVIETVGPVDVSVQWTGPLESGSPAVQEIHEDSFHYSSELQFGSVSSSHSGNYTCQANVIAINSSHLIPTSLASVSVIIDISKCPYLLILKLCKLCFCVVPAPSAPIIYSLQPLNSTSVQIVWMKRHVTDVVDNVTVEYLYQGPCSCSDVALCQWTKINEIADNTSIYSNLQEHSIYSFKNTANNPAGTSPPTEMNVTTLPAGK